MLLSRRSEVWGHAEKFCIGRPQKHCFFDSEHKFLIIPMPNLGNILQTFKTGEAINNKVKFQKYCFQVFFRIYLLKLRLTQRGGKVSVIKKFQVSFYLDKFLS